MEFPEKVERAIEFLSENFDITHEQAFEMLDSTRDIWEEKQVSLIKEIPVELFEIVMSELTFDEKVKLCSVDQDIRKECIARKKYLFKIPHQELLDKRFDFFLKRKDFDAAEFFLSLGANLPALENVNYFDFTKYGYEGVEWLMKLEDSELMTFDMIDRIMNIYGDDVAGIIDYAVDNTDIDLTLTSNALLHQAIYQNNLHAVRALLRSPEVVEKGTHIDLNAPPYLSRSDPNYKTAREIRKILRESGIVFTI